MLLTIPVINSGQFEAAVEFLFRVDRFRAHGVHVGLALNEARLLLASPNVQVRSWIRYKVNNSLQERRGCKTICIRASACLIYVRE